MGDRRSSEASDPGGIVLSEWKLRRLQPGLSLSFWERLLAKVGVRPRDGDRSDWRRSITSHLLNGDSRAAVVMDVTTALVAAYTDELDCVVLLRFDPRIAELEEWEPGTRLLTVNSYFYRTEGLASDLQPGVKDFGRFGNVRPFIADLLTDDVRRLEARKAEIAEEEWSRTLHFARQAISRGQIPRDGRPMRCDTPIEQS